MRAPDRPPAPGATREASGSSASSSSGAVHRIPTPPVRRATTVRAGRDRTFDVFVRELGAWWPVTPFSRGEGRVRDVRLERRAGGLVTEHWDDGTVHAWGELLAWDPPRGFTMAWRLTPEPTEVELRFLELGPSLTRVEVEHRGWERLSDEQLGAACALPEGYAGGSFDRGWGIVLDAFARRVGAA
ncbi:SRPBCC domain-containing protein [Cellulomonas massiliensis]|uniref:SRPBCC domain-containing protein n=1 Tax=Cellulomonas massiliensis TaxID=1465811 RepID=UPI00031DC471|nr:SRPBCC domain-containing protein [Cellulomonas massiliensis]